MNYFGLFFTFMLPGLALGAMAAAVVITEKQKYANKQRRTAAQKQIRSREKLFVYDLMEDHGKSAA